MAARRYRSGNQNSVVEKINALLPQSQCGSCGYPGCRPYAQAVAEGDAINKCAPGGEATLLALAELLNRPKVSPDTSYGITQPERVAFIREEDCIGCGRCLPVCPVDAILGAPQYMHTVITAECTGCDLCLAPCPVNCIDMIAAPEDEPIEKPSGQRHSKASTSELAPTTPVQPCIRCGLCTDVCPASLLPGQLHWYAQAQKIDMLATLKLPDCIECGLCEHVCPSNLPLVQQFREAKDSLNRHADEQAKAARARQRFELQQARNLRLQETRSARRDVRLLTIKEEMAKKFSASSVKR